MPHLLIVEDSDLVASALRILFEAHGYRVSIADGIATAVLRQTETPADVMLLDVTLSDGDGLDVLSRLRECGSCPPPTIALTGHDDDAIRARYLAAGCRAVLVKPTPTAELLAQVRLLETGHL